MSKLSNHQSGQTTKLLLIGDSGAGKTGALASLAAAGYNLRIADFDNGLDILANLLKHKDSPYGKEALDRVSFVTLTDPRKQQGGRLMPKTPTVWTRAMKLFEGDKTEKWGAKNPDGTWEEGAEDLGPIVSWGPKDVLVIDSLSFLSTAALHFVLSMNGRLLVKPYESDWYDGQQLIEGLLGMLYDEAVNCNVVVIAHIAYITKDGVAQGYPNTLGKALPPRVGRYFNSAIQIKTSGQGANRKRIIFTNTSNMVELKTSAPLSVKKEYDVEFGLAEYFADVRGETFKKPASAKPIAQPVPSATPTPVQKAS